MGPPGRMRTLAAQPLEVLAGPRPAGPRALPLLQRLLPARASSGAARPGLRDLARADPFAAHLAHAERVAGEHWLNQLLYVDLKTFLPSLNLTYTDKMSMAASTEVRCRCSTTGSSP